MKRKEEIRQTKFLSGQTSIELPFDSRILARTNDKSIIEEVKKIVGRILEDVPNGWVVKDLDIGTTDKDGNINIYTTIQSSDKKYVVTYMLGVSAGDVNTLVGTKAVEYVHEWGAVFEPITVLVF